MRSALRLHREIATSPGNAGHGAVTTSLPRTVSQKSRCVATSWVRTVSQVIQGHPDSRLRVCQSFPHQRRQLRVITLILVHQLLFSPSVSRFMLSRLSGDGRGGHGSVATRARVLLGVFHRVTVLKDAQAGCLCHGCSPSPKRATSSPSHHRG